MKMLVFNSASVYLTNDKHEVLDDILCPIQCGACCNEWQSVHELKAFAHRTSCPYLKSTGCKLERKKRPIHCCCFICQLGILALLGQVSPQEITNTICSAKQNVAFSFLAKDPNLEEIPLVALKISPKLQSALDKRYGA